MNRFLMYVYSFSMGKELVAIIVNSAMQIFAKPPVPNGGLSTGSLELFYQQKMDKKMHFMSTLISKDSLIKLPEIL